MLVIVRLAPEIMLKSTPVMKRFTEHLVRNIRQCFAAHEIGCRVSLSYGRIFLEIDNPLGLLDLARIYGIGSFSAVEQSCKPTFAAMEQTTAEHFSDFVKGKTFAVRVKRANASGFTSIELERQLGAVLYPYAAGVNLSNPEVTLHLEVRKEAAYFYSAKIPGPGGLPLGVEGRALCLLSGGFDSAVAAWMMMKRGVAVDFLFFNLAGDAYERSVLKVARELHTEWGYGYSPRFHVVPFRPVVSAIKSHAKSNYAQVLLKRQMYKMASLVAERNQLTSFVTGESIGQVSSQTLTNLCVIDRAATVPVFRPLIGMDKTQIIQISRKIGTFRLSEHLTEYCALSEKPVTEARLAAVENEEVKLSSINHPDLLAQMRTIEVAGLDERQLASQYLIKSTVPSGAVVIDCGSSGHYNAWHYPSAVHIEMDQLEGTYQSLEKDKTYLLYCPFGQQSAVLAEKMQCSGYEAYSFLGGSLALRRQMRSQTAGHS